MGVVDNVMEKSDNGQAEMGERGKRSRLIQKKNKHELWKKEKGTILIFLFYSSINLYFL